ALVLCVSDHILPAQQPAASDAHSDHSRMSRLAEAETLANRAAEHIAALFPLWAVFAGALSGTPAKAIMSTCGSWHPELVVLGSHGRSAVARAFLGSVSLELVHRAPCSVRISRTQQADSDSPPRIIIGNDGSKEADEVIRVITTRSWPDQTEA